MSIVIACTTGETVTPAELLGRGAEEKAGRLAAALKSVDELALPPATTEGGTWQEYK